jgi:hypothetical protein
LVGTKFFGLGYEAAHNGAIDETDSRSPLDNNGHCMHTTHLVHGTRLCRAAAFFDYAKGTSTTIGMVPRASIATYKAW